MRLLLSNDDGYDAKGLRELAKRLALRHEVVICAPSRERSGHGHMVTFFGYISYQRQFLDDGIETYSVEGTPADCVIFAVRHLFKDRRFDAVISGVNNVLNIGSDIIYSGTVGVAQEGTFQQIPSIAVSMRAKDEDFSFAAEFVDKNLEKLVSFAKDFVTISVNIPSPKREDIKGVKAAPVVFRPYDEHYEVTNCDGSDFYAVKGKPFPVCYDDPEGDCALIKQGYVTITPIKLIPNDRRTLEEIRREEDSLWR